MNRSTQSEMILPNCSSDSDGVILPRMCSAVPPKFSKAILPSNTKRSKEPDQLLASLNSLVGLTGQMYGVQESDISALDYTCEKQEKPNCPEEIGKKAQRIAVSKVFFPVACDSLYTFCDRNNNERSACPAATCCSMCNLMDSLNACENGAPAQRHDLEINLRMFGTNGLYDLSQLATHEDQEFVDELSTPIMWAADSLLYMLNSKRA